MADIVDHNSANGFPNDLETWTTLPPSLPSLPPVSPTKDMLAVRVDGQVPGSHAVGILGDNMGDEAAEEPKEEESDEQIASLNQELERRVVERTADLEATNRELQAQIADHRRLEKTLRESEEAFRLTFASNPLPMWLYDLETLQFLEVNEAAVAHYGYTKDEFLRMRISEIRPHEDVALLLENVATARPDLQYSRGWRHLKKDGQLIDVQIISHTFQYNGREAALVVAEDITERNQADELIQRQLARLAALRSIDLAITASLDLRVTLNVLLEQVMSQLGVDAADVLLLNPHSQLLEHTAARGFRVNSRARAHVRLGEGYAGRAALERRIVCIADMSDAASFLRSQLAHLITGESFHAYYAAPLVAKGRVQGVLEVFHRSPLEPDPEWLDFLDALAGQAAIAVDNAWLFDGLQRSNIELSLAYDTTLEGWSRALDLRDNETEGHTQRVTEMTVQVARMIGMSETELVHVRRGALLHDIGKMGIPDAICLKPGPLNDEEWEIMRRHPVYAYELLSAISFLRPALDIPYYHHEKWDGTGYPIGLKGEQIPLAARLFAVVDVWDALSSDRPYRAAWSPEKVREHVRSLAGTHFDPRALEAFLSVRH